MIKVGNKLKYVKWREEVRNRFTKLKGQTTELPKYGTGTNKNARKNVTVYTSLGRKQLSIRQEQKWTILNHPKEYMIIFLLKDGIISNRIKQVNYIDETIIVLL